MTYSELTREQIIFLKRDYMFDLVNDGTFAEVMGVDYDEPSYSDLYYADELIPDSVIYEHYGDISFADDDFS